MEKTLARDSFQHNTMRLGTLLLVGIALIAGAAGGFFAGQASVKKNETIAETLPPLLPQGITSFNGKIVEIGDGRLVVEAGVSSQPSDGGDGAVRSITIRIGAETLIFALDPAVLPTDNGGRKKISFADLKKGDTVSVLSAESNIDKSEVTAVEIVVATTGTDDAPASLPIVPPVLQ